MSEELESTQKKDNDEISLVDLFAVLWKYKKMIMITTGIGMIAVIVVCIISLVLPPDKSFMPNKYTPQAEMLISEDDAGAASMLGRLGGLASFAGVNVPTTSTNSALAGYLVNSNTI